MLSIVSEIENITAGYTEYSNQVTLSPIYRIHLLPILVVVVVLFG